MRGMKLGLLTPLLLAGCAHTPPPPTPLFDAFQKYCIATGGETEAVDKAATADGFKRVRPSVVPVMFESTSWNLGTTNISVGPTVTLRADGNGEMHPVPLEPAGSKMDFCLVKIVDEHDMSQAVAAKWAGVPAIFEPNPLRYGDSINDKYSFRIENGRHVTLGLSAQERLDAVKNGGVWGMHFYRRGKETGMSFSHHTMTTP